MQKERWRRVILSVKILYGRRTLKTVFLTRKQMISSGQLRKSSLIWKSLSLWTDFCAVMLALERLKLQPGHCLNVFRMANRQQSLYPLPFWQISTITPLKKDLRNFLLMLKCFPDLRLPPSKRQSFLSLKVEKST